MAMHYEITTKGLAKVNGDITENKSALTKKELRQTREKTYAYSSPFLRCAVWLTIMTLLILHKARFARMTFTSPYKWRVPSAEVCVITGPMCCPKGRHTCVVLTVEPQTAMHQYTEYSYIQWLVLQVCMCDVLPQCTSTATSNDWSSRCECVLCYLNAPVHWVQLHPMTDHPGVHVCCATSMHWSSRCECVLCCYLNASTGKLTSCPSQLDDAISH